MGDYVIACLLCDTDCPVGDMTVCGVFALWHRVSCGWFCLSTCLLSGTACPMGDSVCCVLALWHSVLLVTVSIDVFAPWHRVSCGWLCLVRVCTVTQSVLWVTLSIDVFALWHRASCGWLCLLTCLLCDTECPVGDCVYCVFAQWHSVLWVTVSVVRLLCDIECLVGDCIARLLCGTVSCGWLCLLRVYSVAQTVLSVIVSHTLLSASGNDAEEQRELGGQHGSCQEEIWGKKQTNKQREKHRQTVPCLSVSFFILCMYVCMC